MAVVSFFPPGGLWRKPGCILCRWQQCCTSCAQVCVDIAQPCVQGYVLRSSRRQKRHYSLNRCIVRGSAWTPQVSTCPSTKGPFTRCDRMLHLWTLTYCSFEDKQICEIWQKAYVNFWKYYNLNFTSKGYLGYPTLARIFPSTKCLIPTKAEWRNSVLNLSDLQDLAELLIVKNWNVCT